MLAQIITISIILIVALVIGALGFLIHTEEKKIKKRFFLFKRKN